MDKSSFGYFIVKPDGAKDINGILDDIEDKFDEDMIKLIILMKLLMNYIISILMKKAINLKNLLLII